MSDLFDFVQISPVGGDCTANYKLRFNRVCTVKDFVTDIFSASNEKFLSTYVSSFILGIINFAETSYPLYFSTILFLDIFFMYLPPHLYILLKV